MGLFLRLKYLLHLVQGYYFLYNINGIGNDHEHITELIVWIREDLLYSANSRYSKNSISLSHAVKVFHICLLSSPLIHSRIIKV